MNWTRIEPSLFLMKGVFTYYTVLGAVLLVGSGLLSITNSAAAAGSERISFASNRTGNLDIYIININSENLRNVTNHAVNHFEPWVLPSEPAYTWSPDGHFLTYASEQDGDFKIYVMDTRTREHRRLTHHHESEWAPAWSPDGKWIAFVSRDDYDIYKTDVNGAQMIRLTDIGGNGRPAWSPDGKQIAFFSNKRGKRYSLYVMNADGRRLRRVPDGGIQAIRGVFQNECTWSPDGKQIAFSLYLPKSRREHLCVIDVDGRNFRQLTRGDPIGKAKEAEEPLNFPPPPLHPPLPTIGSPAWSPDGKWIAYVYSDEMFWQTADIYVIDAAGNASGKPLVEGGRQDLSPAWVPDGFLAVFPSTEKQTTLWSRLKQKSD